MAAVIGTHYKVIHVNGFYIVTFFMHIRFSRSVHHFFVSGCLRRLFSTTAISRLHWRFGPGCLHLGVLLSVLVCSNLFSFWFDRFVVADKLRLGWITGAGYLSVSLLEVCSCNICGIHHFKVGGFAGRVSARRFVSLT